MRTLSALLFCMLIQWAGLAAEDVAALREKGIQALKDSESNPKAVIEAAHNFAKAADLYEAAGADAKATEMNSFLFWCKKKMSLEDIEQYTKTGDTATAEKLNTIEKLAPKIDDAQLWFDRADKYAKDNPNEHYLIAVRFFEVASRFLGTKESLAAQERSLKEQGLSQVKAAVAKTAPVAEKPKVGKTVNLLALIDLAKDAIDGKWGFAGGVLVGGKNSGRIEIPYHPPEEYDLKIMFMRTEGNEEVVQILNKSDHSFAWIMDGWGTSASGIEAINGKGGNENSTTFKGKLLANNRWLTSIVQVRNGSFTIFFEGKQIAKLSTDYHDIDSFAGWKMRDTLCLGLGHMKNTVRFSAIELIEITGTGKKTR